MSRIKPSPVPVDRELAYYRRECNDLGARLLRLQEEQSQAFREARRSRTVAKLIREAHRLTDTCNLPGEIGEPMLEVVVDNALCDRAAFLEHVSPDQPGRFRVTHVIGMSGESYASEVVVPAAPGFFFTTSRTLIEPPAYELTSILRTPYVLWAYDPGSGVALILGNHSEGNVTRPFESRDQELVEGALSVYIDVRARKAAEVELRAAKLAAEESGAVRSRFLATLSHELRTPLNSIIGFSEIMAPGSNIPTTEEQRATYMAQINESGRMLLELIDSILDYASLENSAPRLRREWVPADSLVTTAAGEVRAIAVRQDVQLEVMPGDEGLEAFVDRLRFRQVLTNLLGNAVKFTPAEGSVRIGVMALPEGGLEVVVADSGIGMEPADIPRALEPFQQVSSDHRRRFAGTGLGLPIAKSLAEAHGGSLVLESMPGRGTTVRVRLPAEAVRPAEPGNVAGEASGEVSGEVSAEDAPG
ncbi:sensor histidine kinase [Falsiroseomonas sp. HC035]|uniref:sensor histidine kinase n=1 Tax=Falsiroseomonas sp. HC035 TaxID=3390999 RepID=UPI003D318F5F